MCRPFPGMLYDMAAIINGCLTYCTFWDAKVYDDEDVIEWTNDIARYTMEFLAPEGEKKDVLVVQARL